MTTLDPPAVAQTADYALIIDVIQSNVSLDGRDQVYGLLNKKTKVIEERIAVLAGALREMELLQAALDAVHGKQDGSVN